MCRKRVFGVFTKNHTHDDGNCCSETLCALLVTNAGGGAYFWVRNEKYCHQFVFIYKEKL